MEANVAGHHSAGGGLGAMGWKQVFWGQKVKCQ